MKKPKLVKSIKDAKADEIVEKLFKSAIKLEKRGGLATSRRTREQDFDGEELRTLKHGI